MASRRSRIKGIANIPQRRKPTNEETEVKLIESSPVYADKKSENKDEVTVPKNNNEDIILINNDVTKRPPVPNNETLENYEELPDSPKISEITASVPEHTESIKEYNDTEQLDKQGTPTLKEREPVSKKPANIFKRKFQKIPVSLNAIQRRKNPTQDSYQISLEQSHSTVNQTSKLEKKGETETADEISQKSSEIFVNAETEKVSTINCELRLGEPTLGTNLSKVENIENVFQKPVTFISNTPHSDTEYPLPPPSPSKANRSRIKAVPRLAYRKTSFSASESEDESRKINRIRNDSVCSTTSVMGESVAECFSPQRPKEAVAAVQPKKIGIRSEQTRKLAEARKEFIRRFGASKPERNRLTMMDLIFYNPDSNPMMNEANIKENDNEKDENVDDPTTVEEIVDDPAGKEAAKSDEENAMPVPQIKIGPSGEIILDEQSLVIERKEVQRQREEMEKTKVMDADKLKTGYGIYKKHKRSKYWSRSETLHFYKALNTIGTDFMLMCELFPDRNRRDLKIKFKKEEKLNQHLIDRALMQPCSFDFDDLKNEIEMEEREMEELRKQNEEEKRQREERIKENQRIMLEKAQKRKAAEMIAPKMYIPKPMPSLPRDPEQEKEPSDHKRDKEPTKEKVKKDKIHKENSHKPKPSKKLRKERLSIRSYMSDSDADESDLATQSESDEDIILPHKPTRSGRVPKVIQRYDNELSSINSLMKRNKIPYHAQPNNVEPGSIMIITENGPNGEPVYKIYMVTPEQKATPLKLSSDVIAKAIQLKNGVTAQNILTISANVTDDDDEERMPLENNVTIPADEHVTSLKSSEENNLVSSDSELEVTNENNFTIPADENVKTLKRIEESERDVPEENNVTIPADENVKTLRSNKENILVTMKTETDAVETSTAVDAVEQRNVVADEVLSENPKAVESVGTGKVIATESTSNKDESTISSEDNFVVINDKDQSYVTVVEDEDHEVAVADQERFYVTVAENDIKRPVEGVKIIATTPAIFNRNETVICNDDNFVLLSNKEINTEIVLEVSSDGTCSKVSSEESVSLRTNALSSVEEQNITIPVDDGAVALRTKM